MYGRLLCIYPREQCVFTTILSDIFSGKYSGILSGKNPGILSDLSSENLSALNLAVEVRHAVEARRWRTTKRMRRKMRSRMRRKSRTALIKSNKPHLASGAHPSGIRNIFADLDTCCVGKMF